MIKRHKKSTLLDSVIFPLELKRKIHEKRVIQNIKIIFYAVRQKPFRTVLSNITLKGDGNVVADHVTTEH